MDFSKGPVGWLIDLDVKIGSPDWLHTPGDKTEQTPDTETDEVLPFVAPPVASPARGK
jgi:hypothetical protein